MVYSYNVTTQNLPVNGQAIFTVDQIKTGCTVTHTEGTPNFLLRRQGFYFVTVTANVAATTAGTDPVTLTLYNGTTTLTAATASATSTADTDIVNLTINAIVEVEPSCCVVDNNVRLNVVNTGVAATVSNIAITITKIA